MSAHSASSHRGVAGRLLARADALDAWAARHGAFQSGSDTPSTVVAAIRQAFRPPLTLVLLAGSAVAVVLIALGAHAVGGLLAVLAAVVFLECGTRTSSH